MADNINSEDRLIISRVQDAVCSARDRYATRFIGFLDGHGTAVAKQAAAGYANVAFYGGHESAERVFMCIYPDYAEISADDYPFQAVTVTARPTAQLTHRDWLGSLMSLGIRRDSVGDILTDGSKGVIFLADGIVDYVVGQLQKVGGEGVKIQLGYTLPLPETNGFEELRFTVASTRLDCVVSALCSYSRSKAEEVICAGLVTVDSTECLSTTKKVSAGSRIAVRGKGKFIIDNCFFTTRKGRTVMCVRKYI